MRTADAGGYDGDAGNADESDNVADKVYGEAREGESLIHSSNLVSG
jgi:hypothetical protein